MRFETTPLYIYEWVLENMFIRPIRFYVLIGLITNVLILCMTTRPVLILCMTTNVLILCMTTRPVGPMFTALRRTDPNPSIMRTICPIIRLLVRFELPTSLFNSLPTRQAVSLGPTGRVVTLWLWELYNNHLCMFYMS